MFDELLCMRSIHSRKASSDELMSIDYNSIKLSPADEELLKRLEGTDKCAISIGGSSVTKIQKVQKQLREQFMKFYKPVEIAIGPIHAIPGKKNEIGPSHTSHDEDLGMKNEISPNHTFGYEEDLSKKNEIDPCQPCYDEDLNKLNLKHSLGISLIQQSGENYGEKSLKSIKKSFTPENQLLFFQKQVIENYDEEEMCRMLFVDGCAVLQFINSYVNEDIISSFQISIAQADDIRHDLFLLENQIPFEVLAILMRLSDKGRELAESVYCFISMNILAPTIYYEARLDQNIRRLPAHQKDFFPKNKVDVPVHLLDLLRSELLYTNDYSNKSSSTPKKDSTNSSSSINYQRSFRNIQDLKEVDIKFKADFSRGLRSVHFSTGVLFSPKLMLPPLIVDKSTKQKLLNLVAYEMCPDNSKKDYTVASYLRLLDSLIDCEQDVKVLRSAHIIRNHLSSDEEVANLFNSVGNYLVPQDVYVDEKRKIQMYYKTKMASWKAHFCREHFRNPTTFFAFVVGLVILVATCIQAIYTIHPKKD